jgi:DNA-binding XRE family transcriptional regulator
VIAEAHDPHAARARTAMPARPDFTAAELRAWRRQRWLSQPDLAQLLGVKRLTVGRWERGESAIPSFLRLALERLDQILVWSPDGPSAAEHGRPDTKLGSPAHG